MYPDLDSHEKRTSAFIAKEITTVPSGFDLLIMPVLREYELGNALYLHLNENKLGKTFEQLGLKKISDQLRHQLERKYFHDFKNDKELLSNFTSIVLDLRSNFTYNYLPSIPISLTTDYLIYDKRIAKKIEVELEDLKFLVSDLLKISKKLHTYNSSKKLPEKIGLFPSFGSDLLDHAFHVYTHLNRKKVRGPKGEFHPFLMEAIDLFNQFTPYDPMIRNRVSSKIKSNPWHGLEPAYKEFLEGKWFFYRISHANLVKLRVDNRAIFKNLGFSNLPNIQPNNLIYFEPRDAFWIPANASEDSKSLAKDFIEFSSQYVYMRSWNKYTGLPHTGKSGSDLDRVRVAREKNFQDRLFEAYSAKENSSKRWDRNIALWKCKRRTEDGQVKTSSVYEDNYPLRAFILPFLWLEVKTKKEIKSEIRGFCNLEKF